MIKQDNTPLITIVVPCYKVEEYLGDLVKSVAGQTYPHWELVLVDDGSPDRTGELCDAYAAKDTRIKVVHKPNGGLVSARNAGYEAMTGHWHMYIDGDDWIDTDTLEQLVDYIRKFPDTDVFFWKCIQELGDKSIKGKWEWKCPELYHLYLGEECRELARNTLVYNSGIATAYCKLIRSDYAQANGLCHDNRLKQGAEGLEFSLRTFYHAQKAVYINAYWNHYRYNPNSISKIVDERNTQYLSDCFDVIEEDVNGWGIRQAYAPALYERVCYVIIAIAMSTYFHPNNRDNLCAKCRKFGRVIAGNRLFSTAVKEVDMKGMDKLRKITLTLIKAHCYAPLAVIAWLKQYYLKKGKYNY